MQYYRYDSKIDESDLNSEDNGEHPTFWLEVNAADDATRQLVVYPNGKAFSYDRLHLQDSYGALCISVVDGDEDWWEAYKITKEKSSKKWNSHSPLNRSTNLR